MSAIYKYFSLKSIMDQAYGRFDSNPTKQNSDAYGMALNEYRDHCVEIVEKIVAVAPGMLDMIDKLVVPERSEHND